MLERRLRNQLPRMVMIAALATGTAAALWLLGGKGAMGIERLLYDKALAYFTYQNPEGTWHWQEEGQSTQVVVLSIDKETIEGMKDLGPYPWSSSLWGQVVRDLSRQGTRAVLFDGVLDPDFDTEEDTEAFAQALRDTGLPVYLRLSLNPSAAPLPQVTPTHDPHAPRVPKDSEDPTWVARRMAFPVSHAGHKLPELEFQPSPGLRQPNHVIPPPASWLAEAKGVGLAERESDADGVLRRTYFAYTDGPNAYVTLPVAVAADVFGATEVVFSGRTMRLGERTFNVNPDGSAELDFQGRLLERYSLPPALPLLKAAMSLKKNELPDANAGTRLRGKFVIVSALALGESDFQRTPFKTLEFKTEEFRAGEFRAGEPGVIQLATVLENLLNGRFVTETPFWMSLLLALGLALLSTFVLMMARSPYLEVAWILGLVPMVYLGVGLSLAFARVHPLAAMPAMAGLLASLGALAANHLFARREAVFIRQAFSRYMEPQLIEQMIEQEQLPRLDGEEREISAFFSDVRGFSTFSERFRDNPRALVRVLNQYLTRVSSALLREGGCLDKYIGDAVVCLFGAPAGHTNHALRACRGALAAQAEVAQLREEFRAQGLPDVYTRIGINTARLFVGNFGSEQLFDYTALGDGMNLASRLEGANKAYGSLIMIGPRTYELAREHIEVRELDRVRVAGKTEAVQVYELLALKGKLPADKRETVDRYHEALGLYRSARFKEAAAVLEAQLARDFDDGPTAALLERCRKYEKTPPPADWDRVTSLDK